MSQVYRFPKGTIQKYGLYFDPKPDGSAWNALEIEFACFLRGGTRQTTKYDHCRNIIGTLWPHIYINRWAERLLRAFCKNNFTGITGCANSGKSFAMALWALISWWADPLHTLVFVISTTKIAARGRIWGHVQRLFQTAVEPMPGKMLYSVDKIALREMSAKDEQGTDASVLSLIAAGEKDALDKLQGQKNERVVVLCDEGQSVDNAVEDGLWNLKNNPHFEFRVAGNPSLTYDFHGRFCEPATEQGHAMDYEDVPEWPILALGMYDGLCVHFNATDSPNYELQQLGKPPLPYLPMPADVAKTRSVLGRSDPRLWRQSIGVWPKGGVTRNTVFADEDVAKYRIKERVELMGVSRGLGIDPAYTNGGDQFMVTLFEVGRTALGESALQVVQQIPIIEAPYYHEDGTEDIGAFARAYRVRDICVENGIPTKFVGVDSTGGKSFADILDKILGGQVLRVEFGASASDETEVSLTDERVEKKAFGNLATAIWFLVRSFAVHGQLKNISTKVISQLVSRKFGVKNGRDYLEKKEDYKKRLGGASPDESDSLAVGCAVARDRMNFFAGLPVIEERRATHVRDARIAARVQPPRLGGQKGVGRISFTSR